MPEVRTQSASNRPTIRRAAREDASEIAAVLRKSFAEFEPSYTRKAFAATILSTAGVLKRLEEGPIWVGLVDGAIVATASVVIRSDELHVRGMAVIPAIRGQRLGWHFLTHIERFARREAEHDTLSGAGNSALRKLRVSPHPRGPFGPVRHPALYDGEVR